MAFRVSRRLRELLDVNASAPTNGQVLTYDTATSKWIPGTGGGGGAPTTATYITQTADATLSAEQAMGSLATGLVKNTTTTGVQSIAVEGTDYYKPGGTDVAVADGGTGASTAAGARTNLGLVIGTDVQAQDPELAALAGTTSAADKLPYYTGSGTATTTDLTSAARTVLDDTTTGAMLTTLGAAPSNATYITQVAESGLSAEQSLAALATGILKSTTGTGALSIAAEGTDYYKPGGTDVAVADGGTGASTAAGARTNLGVVPGTDVQTQDAELQALAGLTSAADKLPYFTGSGTATTTDLTSTGRSLIDDASTSAMRTTLGLVIGTDVLSATAAAGGDLTGNYPNPTLAAAGPGATGPIGSTTVTPVVTIDAKGRVTALTSATIAASATITYETRSTNTILAAADKAKAIDITAAITQTFTAAATLGAGWWVILHNNTQDGTTVVTLDPNSAETIDGLATPKMYSGETRLIICDGSNFFSELLDGGFARFTSTGANTFQVPAGIDRATIECIGGGGGGGGGRGGAAGSVRQGGTAGGGAARIREDFAASVLGAAGASVTVTVGAGGTSGAGGSSADGSSGGAGGNTTFGTVLTGYGGGAGTAGSSGTTRAGGSGSGAGEAGQSGVTSDSRGGGNTFDPGNAGVGGGIGRAGAGARANVQGYNSDQGGAGGGGVSATGTAGLKGGTSAGGGGGGGSGGGLTTGNVESVGGVGGKTGVFDSNGGGGGAAGAVNGGAGTPGTDGDLINCGWGAGGGGSQDSGTGGAGGAGGAIGGGAGGGGAGTTVGGAGGVGGRGEARIWYS